MKKHLLKDLVSVTNPNSRKTRAIAKKLKKHNKRDQLKLGFANKANIMAKFLVFISERIDDDRKIPLTVDEYETIINEYFHRFDEELEQIKLKTEINKRRQNQHASRESVIKITVDKDQQNFNAGGIELPNLCDPEDFKKFQDWDGNSHNIQHLKMIFISKRILNEMRTKINVPEIEKVPEIEVAMAE